MSVVAEEGQMLPALLRMLEASRRIRLNTTIVTELPWRGRRVDLATLTRSGVTSAYELKLANFNRVLEQAIYNRLSFDRSWIVTQSEPRPDNLRLAESHDIGVIIVNGRARVLRPSPEILVSRVVKVRLKQKILSMGSCNV